MRTRTIALLAVSARLSLLGPDAEASFIGLIAYLDSPDIGPGGGSFGLADVWRIYARFDNSTDTVEAVFGDPVGNPLLITTTGTFYQNFLGLDVDHNGNLDGLGLSVEHDTYVTIGSTDFNVHGATSQQGVLPPSGPGFNASSLSLTNGSWFRTPGDPATQGTILLPGQWAVLIGQFTIERGEELNGLINLTGTIDGSQATITNIVFSTVPTPGVLTLLGVAALAGHRRRRSS